MSDPFTNLAEKTGRSMEQWFALLQATGLEKHTEIMNWLKKEHGVTHGFANGIAMQFRSRGESTEADDLVAAQYAGAKAALLPIRERLLAAARALGDDVEVVPKKASISLRRSKQFALVEPASAQRIQLGLQLKGDPTTDRLLAGNEMCSHRVNVTSVDEIDDELLGWLRAAYDRA
ncbi:hypothetical protein BH10ACT7_BH10ACT7_24150 [soil metagenome]